jgi:ABC-type multidrug transport system fused ATPase/permease subunit
MGMWPFVSLWTEKPEHSGFIADVRRALRLLGARRMVFAALLAKRVIVGVCDLLLAYALYLLFLQLQGGAAKNPSWWIPKTVLETAGITFALVLLRAGLDVYSTKSVLNKIQEIYRDLLFRLICGYTEMQWGRFVERNRTELLGYVMQTTSEAADYYHCCIELAASLIVVAMMAGALVYQSFAAACGLAVMIAMFYTVHRLFLRRRIQESASARETALRSMRRNLSDMLASGKEIRTYGNEDFFYSKADSQMEEVSSNYRRIVLFPQVARILADQGVLALFLVVIIVVQLQHSETTTRLLSLLVFYFVISRRMLPLISQISFMLGKIESSSEVLQILDGELEECSRYRASMKPARVPKDGFALEIDRLDFVYQDGTYVAKNLSLQLLQGELAVLQGGSGEGKSSLLNLIAGLLEPATGEIRVDRRHLAYMPQEVPLLDDTIRNNLLFGLRKIEDTEIMRALEAALLTDLVRALPGGLETRIGDNGILLSGGERQRLSLARAILRNASLLLLDEATSALDEETEQQVLQSLSHSGAAVILVSHRATVTKYAKRVFELRNGKIEDVTIQSSMEKEALQAVFDS